MLWCAIDMSISNVGVVITHKKAKRELLSSATGEFLSGRVSPAPFPSSISPSLPSSNSPCPTLSSHYLAPFLLLSTPRSYTYYNTSACCNNGSQWCWQGTNIITSGVLLSFSLFSSFSFLPPCHFCLYCLYYLYFFRLHYWTLCLGASSIHQEMYTLMESRVSIYFASFSFLLLLFLLVSSLPLPLPVSHTIFQLTSRSTTS